MNRRDFFVAAAASAAVGSAGTPAFASTGAPQSADILTQRRDGLNPPGIRTAGIRMVPVVGGKYKVWTKKIGSGSVKALLLHGGPRFQPRVPRSSRILPAPGRHRDVLLRPTWLQQL